jgi:acetate kinase
VAQTSAADVLTVNAGSSSIRLVAFRAASAGLPVRASVQNRDDVDAAAELNRFAQREDFAAPSVVAHRIVHGGHSRMQAWVIPVDEAVILVDAAESVLPQHPTTPREIQA